MLQNNESVKKYPPLISSERSLGPGSMLFLSLVFLLLFGLAEYFRTYYSGAAGLFVYLFILVALLYFGITTGNRNQRNFWLALGLVPVIRIVSISTPVLLQVSQIFWYIIVSVPLLAGIISLARYFRFSLADIGFSWNKPVFQLLIIIGGAGFGYVDYLILRPAALTGALTLQMVFIPTLILVLLTGIIEELAFRGLLQRVADAGSAYGWILIAAIYAVVQLSHGSLLHCLFCFAVGLIFGWTVKKTRSIIGVGIAHGLLNVGLFLVFPHLF